MILEKKPLTLAETAEYLKAQEASQVLDYIKKFVKLSKHDALKMKAEIAALNNPKIKEENIIKTVDILPKTPEEVNKIFTEASLSESEINSIIEIVKRY